MASYLTTTANSRAFWSLAAMSIGTRAEQAQPLAGAKRQITWARDPEPFPMPADRVGKSCATHGFWNGVARSKALRLPYSGRMPIRKVANVTQGLGRLRFRDGAGRRFPRRQTQSRHPVLAARRHRISHALRLSGSCARSTDTSEEHRTTFAYGAIPHSGGANSDIKACTWL